MGRSCRVRDRVVVIQCTEESCCAMDCVRHVDEVQAVAVEVFDLRGTSCLSRAVDQLLERLGSPCKEVIIVTSDARPAVLAESSLRDEELGIGAASFSRRGFALGGALDLGLSSRDMALALVSYLPMSRRIWWRRTIHGMGLVLNGLYPLAGTALPGIRIDENSMPLLVLQLEQDSITVLEVGASGCQGLDLYDETPTVKRCAELVGEGCPEVALCGGGVDLSEFGYALVQSGRTWVRLPRLQCVGRSMPASFAAMVGAARHTFGLVPPHTIACVPAHDL